MSSSEPDLLSFYKEVHDPFCFKIPFCLEVLCLPSSIISQQWLISHRYDMIDYQPPMGNNENEIPTDSENITKKYMFRLLERVTDKLTDSSTRQAQFLYVFPLTWKSLRLNINSMIFLAFISSQSSRTVIIRVRLIISYKSCLMKLSSKYKAVSSRCKYNQEYSWN